MSKIAASDTVRQLLAVLREALEGPQGDSTYFIDNQPGAGALGTLARLGPEQASRASGGGGTTIAGHAHHLAFSLAAAAAWIRGDRSQVDWSQSWRVKAVDAKEWAALQQRLRRDYEELARAIESHALASEEAFGGAVGALAHAAYHLGALRQKAA